MEVQTFLVRIFIYLVQIMKFNEGFEVQQKGFLDV